MLEQTRFTEIRSIKILSAAIITLDSIVDATDSFTLLIKGILIEKTMNLLVSMTELHDIAAGVHPAEFINNAHLKTENLVRVMTKLKRLYKMGVISPFIRSMDETDTLRMDVGTLIHKNFCVFGEMVDFLEVDPAEVEMLSKISVKCLVREFERVTVPTYVDTDPVIIHEFKNILATNMRLFLNTDKQKEQ